MKRIGVGGSKEQFIASLEQVKKDEFLRASTTFKTLNPNGEFGFSLDGSDKSNQTNNQSSNTEEEDKDPLKLRTFF